MISFKWKCKIYTCCTYLSDIHPLDLLQCYQNSHILNLNAFGLWSFMIAGMLHSSMWHHCHSAQVTEWWVTMYVPEHFFYQRKFNPMQFWTFYCYRKLWHVPVIYVWHEGPRKGHMVLWPRELAHPSHTNRRPQMPTCLALHPSSDECQHNLKMHIYSSQLEIASSMLKCWVSLKMWVMWKMNYWNTFPGSPRKHPALVQCLRKSS